MSRRWFVPEVVQTSAMDCGPASLKALLEGFRVPISYGRLREACQTDVDGTSIDTMEEVAKQLGLDAAQTMLPVDHLLLASAEVFPALIVIRAGNGQTHFVILWRRVGHWVQVMDPALGRYWTRESAFMESVYQHSQPLPAVAWREWAGGGNHRKMMAERLGRLGVGRAETATLLAKPLEDESWRGFSDLDGAIRLVQALVASGAVSKRSAPRLVRAFVEQPEQIPGAMRSVTAVDDETIALRGAVFVHAEGPSKEGAAHDLSPELAAALAERAPPAGRALLQMMREDGLLAPMALLSAMLLASAGTLLEGLLLRGMFDLARELPIAGQRAAAFAAVLAILSVLLLAEIPYVLGLLRMGRQLELRLRSRFLAKLPRLGDRYFQSRPKSDMAERSHSLHSIRHLPEFGARTLRAVCDLGFTSAGVLWLDPGAALPLAIYIAVALGLPWISHKALMEKDLRLRTHAGALGRFYLDALLGLFAIRAHGAELSIRHAHRMLLGEWSAAALRLQCNVVALDGVQMIVGYGLGAWIILDHFRRHGEASTGLLLVYWVLSLPTLAQSLVQAAWQYPGFRNVTLRLLEPLGALEEPLAQEVLLPQGAAKGMAIRMEDVLVRAGGHTILRDFNLDIKPGTHVAIVGPSGAGKSSFVGLLLGWHRPASGFVAVDGVELKGGAASSLRRQIAWVDPEVHLWNASCIDNLSYGAKADELAEIGSVVEKSELMEMLGRLPDGLQTRLGEGGAALSGGQGQRVRVGRAMLRAGARLVILDEAFRGLDHDKRVRLTDRVREHWSGATMLCITHDVASTSNFDRVLVIECGRVVEDGSPDELAARAGSRYRALLEAEHELSEGLWSGTGWQRYRIEYGNLVNTGDEAG